ncbi:AAA family ATPase (plasmid) [Klebsiella pneumoniae]|nr:AAA family ATPase [Klebsiella pneumoniae]
MRLHTLKINGFKRIHNAQVKFGDATFLIGSNNAGKSSVLKAIEWLLSDKKRMASDCFCSEVDAETGENKISCKEIILEAEFRNVPDDAKTWRGFKGRVFSYDPTDSGETGNSIFYRKSYTLGEDVLIELKSLKRELKKEFENLKKPLDFIESGVDAAIITELFSLYGSTTYCNFYSHVKYSPLASSVRVIYVAFCCYTAPDIQPFFD